MKRVSVLMTACAAVMLLAGPAAAAPTAPLHASDHAHAARQDARAAGRVDRTPLRYIPLARTLTGTGTISLNVYTFSGLPDVGAETVWWVTDGAETGTGSGTTDASGQVTMTDVPAATSSNGEIAAFPNPTTNPDNPVYDLWGLDWDTVWGPAGLQPGHLPLTITRSGDSDFNDWDYARVRLYSQPDANQTHMARSDIARTLAGDTTDGDARTITTGSETLSVGTVYFWDDEGMELPVSGTAVSPGTTASPALDVHEADAQAIWTSGWGSGKPGTKTQLVLDRYPAGWGNEIGGNADWPETAPFISLGSKISSGATLEALNITIPSGAAPGYKYWIWADHTSGPLSLVTSFQTCTLKASKTTIVRGSMIKLSGVIPTKGHSGSKRGITKSLVIYKTTKNTSQPTTWQPKSALWTKVATVRANGLGEFTSGSLKPTRTTRYVVRYPGDSAYWGAFTSVCTVTVK
jgi:hypothetical protein